MSADAPSTLTIAVLTYRRPDDLVDVLPLLVDQALSVASAELDVRVLVVDNDPDGLAQDAVRSAAALAAVPVVYVNERTPGISAARNRAIDESADQDLLVFIDDDERPTEEWLLALLAQHRRSGAAAVVGPVVSRFQVQPDSWVTAGGFFDRRRLPTGTRVHVAATNNLLLDLRDVRAAGLRFDLEFGITGGDDTMFTRSLAARGGAMVWCDEAVVVDVVPAGRVTRDWVVRRALSSGNSWSLVAMRIARGPSERVSAAIGLHRDGLVRLVGGAARVAFGTATRSASHRARGVRTAARGIGMILGAWGYRYLEYRRS